MDGGPALSCRSRRQSRTGTVWSVGSKFGHNFLQKQNTYDLNPYTFEFEDRRKSYVAAVYLQDEVTFNKISSA